MFGVLIFLSSAWPSGAADAAEFDDAVTIGRGVSPKIAINDNGAAVAVWQQPRRLRGGLRVATRSADGGWSAQRTIRAVGSSPRARGSTPADVAIDLRGNAVVVWTQTRRVLPPREAVLASSRRRGGRWSAPQTLTTVNSPEEDLEVAPGRHIRPSVAFDADGNGLAVWTRRVAYVAYGTERYVVQAATMSRDGRWTRPQALGRASAHPALDIAPNGDAIVLWTAGALDAGGWSSHSVMAATRPNGGAWSPPETVIEDRAELVLGVHQEADVFARSSPTFEADGSVTALWRRDLSSQNYALQVARRTAAGQWSAPATLEPNLDIFEPPFLGTDARGGASAVWLASDPDTADKELRAAGRDVQGRWTAERVPVRPGGSPIGLEDAAMSANGHVVSLVWRNVPRLAGRGIRQSEIEAYLRTPDRVWLRPQVLHRARSRFFHVCSSRAALASDGRGVAVWSCRIGPRRSRTVMAATVSPD